MGFIRPEAQARLLRWREAIAGAVVVALGLYWLGTSFGLLRWLAVVVVLVGAVLVWSGAQRARFRGGHGGTGIVEVDERQIAYLAPVGGGFISIDSLTRVEIGPDRAGLPVWRFRAGMELLTIPASAEGTDALYEALAALPGVNFQAAIRATAGRPGATVVIWQKPDRRLR